MTRACLSLLLATTFAACATTPATRPAPPPAPEATHDTPLETDQRTDPLAPPADVSGPPADADVLPSGVASKLIRRGTGHQHPGTFSVVRVAYTGWTTDGKEFDSSIPRGAPAQFALNQVIPGWREGLELMVEGEKRRLWIPARLAYAGTDGPQGMLVFDVELLKIVQP